MKTKYDKINGRQEITNEFERFTLTGEKWNNRDRGSGEAFAEAAV